MAPDPTAVRSIAVTVQDLVAAVETNRTSSRRAVLRLTPPFSGRMRARLHVEQADDDPRTVHVPPSRLLADDAPSYPRPAETEAALRATPGVEYTVERHRERHAEAVAEWRSRLPSAVRDRATIDTPAGPHAVAVTTLGDPPAGNEQ
jgi:hypothetical protein